MKENDLRKLAGLPLKEAYEGSNEFDDDVARVTEFVSKASKIMKSANMKKHIKDTKENYGVDTSSQHKDAVKALEDASSAVQKFYDEMLKASEYWPGRSPGPDY